MNHVTVKPLGHQCVWSDRVARAGVGGSRVSTDSGGKGAHLAGFGIHVPAAKEFFYDTHVLLGFHGGQGCQHDGRVARLVLVIHVTHVCRETSLVTEKPSFSDPSPHGPKEQGWEEACETASRASCPRMTWKEL